MKTVNINEAKTQLSKLIEEASKGESFVIAKAGKPLAKVTALSAQPALKSGGSVSWPDRSLCLTTLTGWVRRRSSKCSAVVHETSAGYTSPPLGRR
jgi:prevent-host-death family protein